MKVSIIIATLLLTFGCSTFAQTIAKEEGAWFIDLNELVAIKYESLGDKKVAAFFLADHRGTGTTSLTGQEKFY